MVFGVFHTDGISWVQWMLDVGEGGVNPKPVHPAPARTMFKYYNLPFRVVNGRHPTSDTGHRKAKSEEVSQVLDVGVPHSGGTPCCLVNHGESKSDQSAEDYKKIPVLEINNRSSLGQKIQKGQVLALGARGTQSSEVFLS